MMFSEHCVSVGNVCVCVVLLTILICGKIVFEKQTHTHSCDIQSL